MSIALRKVMTREAFFTWAQGQEARYEFDGVQPVAMTGGTVTHARLIRNINYELTRRLAGTSCEPLGPDSGVATDGDKVRYPDAVVTCATLRGQDLLVPDPVVVFEVISPSSARLDRVTKLQEYQSVASIRSYVLVEAEQAIVTLLSREAGGEPFRAAALAAEDTLELPEIGVAIPLEDIYRGTGIGQGTELSAPE